MRSAGARLTSGQLAVTTAVAGTIAIAAAAFWLSFTALADLARRSGIHPAQAWAWPLIVDGIIVVATVAVVALAGRKATWYPWLLLVVGAIVSVTANALHAVVAADADLTGVLAASVAAVPPIVLLAITHLTVVLAREFRFVSSPPHAWVADFSTDAPTSEVQAVDRVHLSPRERARRMRGDGMSNKAIARATGVHPSTVGRWLASPGLQANDIEDGGAR